MFLTSAWIGRSSTRCFLCDWFTVIWSRTASSMAMGTEQGKGWWPLCSTLRTNETAPISHTRQTEPSKRTIIWWLVYEQMRRNTVTLMLWFIEQGEERLAEAFAKWKAFKTMPTYLPKTGGKSYIRFETSWTLCTLSNKFPRPGTVLPTGFPAKDKELQLKKTLHSCNFQCVPSLQCCEEWTHLALLTATVVRCSYLNWSCSAYWTISDLHAH